MSVHFLTHLANDIHAHNVRVGWWDASARYGKGTVDDMHLVATKLALAHSEISEGLEGLRKGKMDDHLPEHPMLAVEIGDAIIRLLDVAGYFGYDIGAIVDQKRAYNDTRADHKREARNAPDGKAV